jgi:hypothetical protein
MRAGEPELLHRPLQFQRVLDIEDGERMMRQRGIPRRQHGAARQHCSQSRSQAVLLLLGMVRRSRLFPVST